MKNDSSGDRTGDVSKIFCWGIERGYSFYMSL